MGGIGELSPVYLAVVHYQRKEYDECIEICSKVLDKNPYNEAIWSLKTRALTAQVSHCNIIVSSLYTKCFRLVTGYLLLLMISYLGNSR